MTRVANRFFDPRDGSTYFWPINHLTEDPSGQERNYERTAPTSGVGFVRQQGDDSPQILKLTGTILHASQHAAFIHWFKLARTRSVVFLDWTGAEYEVLIASYQPTREHVLRNPRDPAMVNHIIRWTMVMEVLNVRNGPWMTA